MIMIIRFCVQNVKVLHPDAAMDVFPHMLEPPSTFKDKCLEAGGEDDLVKQKNKEGI